MKTDKRSVAPVRKERSRAEIVAGLEPPLAGIALRAYIEVARDTPGSVVTMDPDAEGVVV